MLLKHLRTVAAIALCLTSSVVHDTAALPTTAPQDYAKALHLNFLFYEAQRSGVLPKRRLAWRDDSCVNCYGPKGEDLRGGYYEAANTMKWGLPKAFMITQNAYGAIEFEEGFREVQELHEVKKMVRWGVEYLVNCYSSFDESHAELPNWEFVEQFEFVGHYGDSEIDFEMFSPPEYMDEWDRRQHVTTEQHRLLHYVNKNTPSSEITAETAAAMAASAILLRDDDPAFAARLILMAKQLLRFAILHKGSYRDSSLKGFRLATLWYPPSGPVPYNDEISWGAAWLYRATNEQYYLDTAETYYKNGPGGWGGWNYSWDEKGPGLHMLLLRIGGPSPELYIRNAKSYFDGFLPATRTVEHTPGGLNYIYHWGANRYASHTAFLGFVFVKMYREGLVESTSITPSYIVSVENYSASQINYLLGDNPQGYSWMVGYGDKYAQRPYHVSSYNSILNYPLRECPCKNDDECVHNDPSAPVRCVCERPDGTSCNSIAENFDDFLYSDTPNQHILYGAIVGSPVRSSDGRASDTPVDNRNDYEYTEVTQDYNAAMGGSLAAMILEYKGQMSPQSDCGLDLGWDHPNAWQRPADYWPANDCYHRCDCTPTSSPTPQPTLPTPKPTKQPTRYCPNGLYSSGSQNCKEWPDCCSSGLCYAKGDGYWAACLEECNPGMVLGGGSPWTCEVLSPEPRTAPPSVPPTKLPTSSPQTLPPGTTNPPNPGSTSPPNAGNTQPPSACPSVSFMEPVRDCTLEPNCCPSGTQCFRATMYWAQCMDECDLDDWDCTVVEPETRMCERIFVSDMLDCSMQPNCCAEGTTCMKKNQYWAACKASCVPGHIDNSGYNDPWECSEIVEPYSTRLSDSPDAPWNLAPRNGPDASSTVDPVTVSAAAASGCIVAGAVLFAARRRSQKNKLAANDSSKSDIQPGVLFDSPGEQEAGNFETSAPIEEATQTDSNELLGEDAETDGERRSVDIAKQGFGPFFLTKFLSKKKSGSGSAGEDTVTDTGDVPPTEQP